MNGILFATVTIGVIGIVIALLLNFASDKFYVRPNEQADRIRELLPGNNCGACGFAGCDALAEAIAAGKAEPNTCPVGNNAEQIGEIVGKKSDSRERRLAFVACGGDCGAAQKWGDYYGAESCLAAKAVQQNGGKMCQYGCMGFGDCVSVCVFEAISIRNGIAQVDPRRCTGCGRCAGVCPNRLISLIPATATVKIACSSPEKGAAVKKACQKGCLGCGLCVKNCPNGALTMNGSLPVIDRELCTGCGLCKEKCPAKVIE